MQTFPETFSFTGPNKPERWEADIHDLEVEGEIPADLDGAFYRVQPDPQFTPLLGDDIAFNGDGAISMFRFRNGRCDFKHRWVHTDKWKLEREAGRALFGAYRNPLTDDPSVKGRYRGTANTTAFIHGGKLYALKEDSPAVVMDANTLETHGYTTFDGKMTGETFTAHPKIDPETGDMIAFGYASKGVLTLDMTYYEISPEGELKREIWFELPYYAMMHDFAITRDYALFHVVPSTSSWERLEAGLPHFGFDTTLPVYLGVLPRREGATAEDIRWFKRDNCFASHVMNAFQEGTKIHFDTPEAKNNMFPFFPDIHGAPFNPMEAASFLTRWTVDMASNSEAFDSVTRLTNMMGEFPRIDERYQGRAYRYGWMLVIDPAQPVELKGPSASGMLMNCLGMVDHATGAGQKWWCGPVSSLQEPCFIPRSADAPEGDGYIVQVCNRLEEGRSDLLLFEALDIAKGPIATIRLPLRLRFGLHGNWADGAVLDRMAA
ncbi:MAG: carotenoid oxygenase family protein [Sphingomonadaceae bacterium]|nr:carotenoid oxygenase family protein [Sphingomonadaceae bacterium]